MDNPNLGDVVNDALTRSQQTYEGVKDLKKKVETLHADVLEALQQRPDPIVPDPPVEPENKPPKVEVIKPLPGQVFEAGQTVKMEAMATDEDGTIETVIFFVDGAQNNIERVFPYEGQFTASFVANGGQHTIMAVATDNEGAVVDSQEVLIIVEEEVIIPDPVLPPQVAGPFLELEEGVIGFEAEAMDKSDSNDWEPVEVPNASSRYAIQWNGDDSFDTYNEEDAMVADIVVGTPGIYQLKVRSIAGDKEDPSKKNDAWVAIKGGNSKLYSLKDNQFIYAKANPYGENNVTTANDSSNGALKFYNNNPFEFGFQTSAIDNDPNPIFIEFPEIGTYQLYIGARSSGFAIDMVFLKLDSIMDEVVDKYIVPGGGGGPVVKPIDPQPVGAGVAAIEDFVEKKTGDWYKVDVNQLPDGIVKEDVIKKQYNATDAFIGMGERFLCEDVAEMGGVRAFCMFTPPNRGGGGNYYERVSVPKSMDYANARGVVLHREFFSLKHGRTGNEEVDRRTFTSPPHAKGAGFQSQGGPPQSCSNPIRQAGKAELTTLSFYGWQMPKNGLNAKGDLNGRSLPQGRTEFDPADKDYIIENGPKKDERYLRALGAYFADVEDYKCQSQIYPVKPGTNYRYLFEHGVIYREWIMFVANTFTAVKWDTNGEAIEWVDNKDGAVLWVLQTDGVNNGEPWVAAELLGRSITMGRQMDLTRGGIGLYHGGNSDNDYLGVSDGNPLANGMWFSKDQTAYLAK